MPVMGVRVDAVEDTYWAARGGRRHLALDIMAPRGTPILAAVDGWVWRVKWHRLGGNTLYLLESSGRYVLLYAHLDGYAEGVREGMPVRQGEVLGYVGATGNVRGRPHLHLQLGRIRSPERWWQDEPINPRPYLRN